MVRWSCCCDISVARARRRKRRSKLFEEADVVFDEQANVVDSVLPHRDALDAEAERPALVLFGVDAARGEDVQKSRET